MFCSTRYDKVIVMEAILFRALESAMKQSDFKKLQLSVFSLVLLQQWAQNEQLKLMLLRRLKLRAVARSSPLTSVNL